MIDTIHAVQQPALQPNNYLVAGFVLLGVLANVALFKTVAEVNAHLPEGEKFSWWWWTLGKHIRLWKAHKRLCPASHWRNYSILLLLGAFAFMVLIASTVWVSVR